MDIIDSTLQIKEKAVKNRIGFLIRAAKTSKILKEVKYLEKKMEVKQPIMETVEHKMLKWNGHAVPKRILTSSPEGTKRGGRAEME